MDALKPSAPLVAALLVAAGGAAGATVRHLVTEVWEPDLASDLPWATLAVNLAGAALLGWLVSQSSRLPVWGSPLLATGVCGALTTFATFAVEAVELVRLDRLLPAAAYVLVTVIGSLGALAAGQAAGGHRSAT